jgi:putative DNA primase/helicase
MNHPKPIRNGFVNIKPPSALHKASSQKCSTKIYNPKTVADLHIVEVENRQGEFERYGEFVCIKDEGLYLFVDGKSRYVCEPLFVAGNGTDSEGRKSWINVKFTNRLDRSTTAAIPIVDFDSPKQLVKSLKLAGFPMEVGESTHRAKAIAEYVRRACQVCITFVHTKRDGWTTLPDGKKVYVYGATSFGSRSEKFAALRVNASEVRPPDLALREQWLGLLRLLKSDSLAVFGMCAVFAAPLLAPLNFNAQMVFFVGLSSTGKTVLLKLLASAFDSPESVYTFSGTDSGIEANALLHRDKPFIIDEVGQSDGRQLQKLAYSLSNGASKQRAKSDGSAATIETIRMVLISAGEVSPQQEMLRAGHDLKLGHMARLTVIPVNEKHGVWSTLGDYATGAEKSDHISAQLKAIQGIAGRGFCKKIAPHIDEISSEFESTALALAIEIQGDIKLAGEDNVVCRVLRQFALYTFAGLQAVKYKIVPWLDADIKSAAKHCFALWYSSYSSNRPARDTELIAPVRLYLQSFRGSKFRGLKEHAQTPTGTVAGFEHILRNGSSAFLVYPTFFEHEMCGKHDPKSVLTALRKADLLMEGPRGVPTRQVHLPGTEKRSASFYAIRQSILFD